MKAVRSRQVMVMIRARLRRVRALIRKGMMRMEIREVSLSWTGSFIVMTVVWC